MRWVGRREGARLSSGLPLSLSEKTSPKYQITVDPGYGSCGEPHCSSYPCLPRCSAAQTTGVGPHTGATLPPGWSRWVSPLQSYVLPLTCSGPLGSPCHSLLFPGPRLLWCSVVVVVVVGERGGRKRSER